ncbi:MAG: O-antigen ligase family protein [Planctomycetes bacterium]|nr:O-antigen ligase family protein [Planctomycetota bacterium]
MSAGHPLVDDAPHRGWLVTLWISAAALFALPGVFDLGVIKTAGLALLAAACIIPLLALWARDEIALWFASPGARLHVFAVALALVWGAGALTHASVVDRVLLVLLVHVSAVIGTLAAQRRPQALVTALRVSGTLFALACWLQQLGLDTAFNANAEGDFEITGLAGNTTRAGAFLAFALLALVADAVGERVGLRPPLETPPPAPRRTAWRALATQHVPLVLVSSALVLTRARGARLATLLGLLALGIALALRRADRRRIAAEADLGASPVDEAAARFGPHVAANAHHAQGLLRPPPAPAMESATDRRPAWPVLAALVLGVALAGATGGREALTASKLDDTAPGLSGDGDLTLDVRLALWGSTLDLAADHPWLGVGLGRFRESFPPYRDPLEAALPGRGGAATSVHHPHDEFLLGAAEGGLAAGLALLLLAATTLRRAFRSALLDVGGPSRTALVVVVAGCALALVQDAWTDPTTAVPFFCALGFAWSPRSDEARAWHPAKGAMAPLLVLAGLGAALLAWPRLDGHLAWRHFVEEFAAHGGALDGARFDLLVDAAETCPGDVDLQASLVDVGRQYAALVMRADPGESARAIQAVDRARARLAVLAPYEH